MAELAGAIGVAHNPFFPLIVARGGEAAEEIERLYSALRREFERMRPDTLVVLTTDHYNNFFDVCVPIFCIGVAESASGPRDFPQLPRRELRIDIVLARELHREVVQRDFDVAMSQEFDLDHTITAPLGMIAPEIDLPIVPIFVSSSLRPIPSARRCRALGGALRKALDESGLERRVVVVASGGLSFDVGGVLIAEDSHVGVPDPGWVDRVADRLRRAEIDELTEEITPAQLLQAGNASGEILNWSTMLGMFEPRRPSFLEEQRHEGNIFASWIVSESANPNPT
jgi:aromatic ring-opening dioxygenase catalytic subunit (LigB family)